MEEQWITRLMQEHSESLFRFLALHTDNREDAEDLMQDIFTNCYKARDRFDSSKCSEVAWLFIIAKNRLKNYYRDKKTSTSLDAIEVEQKDPTDYMARAIHLMHCREIAAEVIWEDWDRRTPENNPKISREMIARCFNCKTNEFEEHIMEIQDPTVSFVCQYATAAGIPIDELLYKIDYLADKENYIIKCSIGWAGKPNAKKEKIIRSYRDEMLKNCPDFEAGSKRGWA